MGEWTSYRLEDFLLFAPRTYHRLFELHNAALWPLHPVLLMAGALIAALAFAGRRSSRAWLRSLAMPVTLVLLALVWIGTGVGFHWRRYADINWAAGWFGAAFVAQAALLAIAAGGAWMARNAAPASAASAAAPGRVRLATGAALAAAGLLLWPALGLLEGRNWRAAEWFGAAPDPTAIVTLGILLMVAAPRPGVPGRWLLRLCWPIPLAWCAISGATLMAMQAELAALLPLSALLALTAAVLRR